MNQSPQVEDINKIQVEGSFVFALNEVLKNKKVRRSEWNDKEVYMAIEDDILMIFLTDDNMLHPLKVSTSDILGKDWVVVE